MQPIPSRCGIKTAIRITKATDQRRQCCQQRARTRSTEN